MRALACFPEKEGTIESQYRDEITTCGKFYRARRLGASVPHPPAPKDSLPTKRGFLFRNQNGKFARG